MASTNDSSGKGPKPGPEAPRKPSALIDLKPNEVDIKDPAKDVRDVKDPAKDAKDVNKDVKETRGEPAKPGEAAPAAGKTGTTDGERPRPTPAASAARPASGAPSAAAAVPARVEGGSRWLRSSATHLVAGLAGGLLALLGAERLKQAGGETAAASRVLEARLQQLEQSAARPPAVAPELGQRLAAAEQRLADLDRAAKSAAGQAETVAGETKALAQLIAQQQQAQGPAGSAPEERIAKLEEMLATLASAAASDPQRGRIPQLAAITSKLADLESSLATQITQLRRGVTQEVDSRLAQSADAAQAARAGTQRLDRELATVKTETAQVAGRLDGLKSQADRLDASLKGVREETASLKADLGSVREDVARELRQVARPTDVRSALSPLTDKLSLLEQNVQGVVRSEDDRRANVERIVMALELGNLKRAIERGATFANELAEVRRVAGPKLELGLLERYKDRGVPSLGDLERDFRSTAFAIIDGDRQPSDGHWTDRLLASAKSVVRVRKVDQGADDTGVEAQVARMELALKAGRLGDVMAEAGKLAPQARAPARTWLERVEARAAVDRAIGLIEQELKASLGAATQPAKKG